MINCLNGLCEHPEHKVNYIWWVLLVVAITYTGVKYYYDTRRS